MINKKYTMSVTILEALQNADYNLQNNGSLGLMAAKMQVHNATILLEKGYSVDDDLDALLEPYESVDELPEKNN